jgi:cysteinyl-tRNA synthetase
MEDDLNTADAISSVFELVKFTNSEVDETTGHNEVEYALKTLLELAKVLGILTRTDEMPDDEIIKLIEERKAARASKDFKRSDEIRDILKERGIILEDTKDGVKWKRA